MRNGKTAVAFIAVLLVSFAVMNMLPASDLPQACVQEVVLALVVLAGVGLAAPRAFKRCTKNVQQRSLVRFVAAILLFAGFVGGVISLFTWCLPGSDATGGFALAAQLSVDEAARNIALLLGICALTGVYEEAFMRVLGIGAFERALDTKRAVMVSALLFALLHVGVPGAGAGEAVLLQVALKFAQTLLFGVVMGMLYVRTRRLWPCALIHAGFDVFYLGPRVLFTGALPVTYASGTANDSVLLAVTTILLAVTTAVLAKRIAQKQ